MSLPSARTPWSEFGLLRVWSVVLLLGVSFVGSPGESCAQTGAPSGTTPGRSSENEGEEIRYTSQAALGKGLTHAVLSNGLTVLVQENHAAPVVTVRCFARNTGSAYEGEYLGLGVSHLLEHLIALGSTTKRPEATMQQLLDSMGGQTNAFTTTDLTAYYIDCPSRHAGLAIELLADSMRNSTIPEAEFRREMGVVQRELEMGEAERPQVIHQALKELLYTTHPLRHPTIGYSPVVQRVRREQVLAFYRERYVPQNLIFVVVGDIDTGTILEDVRRHFQGAVRTTERTVVLPVEPEQASPRTSLREMEGPTTHFAIAWPTVRLQHPDLYALDVASYLLTNGDSSRLVSRLRVEQALAIGVESASYTPGLERGWFEIGLECEPDKLAVCRQTVQEEITRLRSELVPPQELAKVKRQKAAEHVFHQQTVQEQANALAISLISTGDPLFDERYVQGIQAVTAEQVRDVAVRYFVPERTCTVIIDPLGTRRATAHASRDFEETPVIRHQLTNGLTVLLKRHSVTPVVSIQALVKGGVLAEAAEKNGVAALTTELMTRGTEHYTGPQIAEYFDSIGGSLVVSSQRNTSFLQSLVLKDDLPTALDYAREILFQPRLGEEDFATIRETQLTQIGARKGNPQTEALDFWASQLPRETPYSRTVLGSVETVQALQVEDCRTFHRQFFVPNNMVLAIYGDADPEELLPRLEETWGKIPAAPALELPQFAAALPAGGGTSANLPTQKPNTAMLVVGFPSPPATQVEERTCLEVINGILTGGGGVGGRLFQELRGEQLVYYVLGQEITGPAPGFFLLMAQTRPETLPDVLKRIQMNLSRIAREGVPAEELQRVQQKLIAAHALRNVTPQSQAFQAAVDELLGLGYDHDRGYETRIQQVTGEQLQHYVREWFQRAFIATTSPAPRGEPQPATKQ